MSQSWQMLLGVVVFQLGLCRTPSWAEETAAPRPTARQDTSQTDGSEAHVVACHHTEEAASL